MNATIKLVHAHFDADHLEVVKAEMVVLGAPTIRAVDLGDNLFAALEGCHRIRAAATLGIPVILELIDYSNDLMTDAVPGWDGDEDETVESICDNVRGIDLIEVEVES